MTKKQCNYEPKVKAVLLLSRYMIRKYGVIEAVKRKFKITINRI